MWAKTKRARGIGFGTTLGSNKHISSPQAFPSVRPQGDQPAQVIVELVTLGLNIENRPNGQRSSAFKTSVSVLVGLAEYVGEIDTNLACSKVYD